MEIQYKYGDYVDLSTRRLFNGYSADDNAAECTNW